MNDILIWLVGNWHIPLIAVWFLVSIGGSIWVTRNLTDEERARFPYL
jgi:hypothetical protein